ncbi:microtubule-binding protein cornetto [Arctopsyche grandis]|uniref:microtubule-binding protein cornetto n=1 Tax=Arctopsyche grandis TaxID=121162 RepID=UPI00406D876C
MCDDADAPFDISGGDASAVERLPAEATCADEENNTNIVEEDAACQQNFNIEQAAMAVAGSDSGVEVAPGEYASSGAPEPLSCASSLISCGSGCDDSFDILSCKNADRLDDFKTNDGTSEGGSESSSITGSGSARVAARRLSGGKKRVAVTEPGKSPRNKPSPAPRPTQGRAPSLATRERARSREKSAPGEKPPPPTGPKPIVPPRNRPRTTPDSLALICRESPSVKVKSTKTSSVRCRTPGASSPVTNNPITSRLVLDSSKSRMTPDSKAAYDKYATLPRRKRENSPELSVFKKEKNSQSSIENVLNKCSSIFKRSVARDRDSPPLKSLPPYPKGKHAGKIRIYHETSVQTVLCGGDVENALAGIGIKEIRTDLVLVKKVHQSVQVDTRNRELEKLEAKVRTLTETNSKLQSHCKEQADKLVAIENRLEEERADKIAAQEELQKNTQRVLSMLGGNDSEPCGDSLMLLESQLQTSANIVVKQQEEINKLHNICRGLQQELNRNVKAFRSLESHLEETEQEANELQEFLQAEKSTLQEALREGEEMTAKLNREVVRSRRECRLLVRISEQRRHEVLAARARLAVSRPSQTTPSALPQLAQRLQSLLQTLIQTYSISPDDLEEVIFHNEAFSRSGSSEACSPGSPIPRSQPATSLPGPTVPFQSSRFSDDENSADLLDSETEPCLMMENVLEDVALQDTYSHNFVSSGLSIMSCPNTEPQNIQEDAPLTCPILGDGQINGTRFLHNGNKEDSFSSLHNITTFSGDELSPAIPDEKPISESSYYPDIDTFDLLNMGYSEHDSLQNLSQAILNRQQSEAECSMSEDALNKDADAYANMSNSVVDQVIVVDNLISKLLKTLRIVQSLHDSNGQTHKNAKDKLNNICEEVISDSRRRKCFKSDASHNLNGSSKSAENICESRKVCQYEKQWSEEHGVDDKWCHKNYASDSQLTSQMYDTEEPDSPHHGLSALADCNVSSPQPIDSAA